MPALTWDLVWKIVTVVASLCAVYFSTIGGQNRSISENATKIAVLYERTGQLGQQFTDVNKSLDLVRQETVAHFVRIIEIIVTGKMPKSMEGSYLPIIYVADGDDLDKLKEHLERTLPLKTPQSALQEKRILEELDRLAKKEKAGELSEEEAIYMGRLGDELSQLKQRQILESLRRNHGVIDCSLCKRLCGPYI